MKKYLIALVFVLSLQFNGCMAIYSVVARVSDNEFPTVYQATRDWHDAISSGSWEAAFGFFLIPDLPFTIAVETAFLPLTVVYTIIKEIRDN